MNLSYIGKGVSSNSGNSRDLEVDLTVALAEAGGLEIYKLRSRSGLRRLGVIVEL